MKIGLTGGTGFIGRYLIQQLAYQEHSIRCWHRPTSDISGFETWENQLEWIPGRLADAATASRLVEGCDAIVHSALDRPGSGFRGAEGDLATFVETNVLGTIRLIEAARAAGVGRFIFISTCAVHEEILDDRPLDETHPLWPRTHYGAHKAAIEKFVHSYGLGESYDICALRPSGVYGVTRPPRNSKWFPLIDAVVKGEPVDCRKGGKEVHAADVAQAVGILLSAEGIAGQAYSCCDRYISEHEVATLAKEFSGSDSEILGEPKSPKHQIETRKLRALGMQFGATPRLRSTIESLVKVAQGNQST